jgi:hypothetical protein
MPRTPTVRAATVIDVYHYTCRHAARRIGRRGVLVPTPQPFLGGVALVWLTNLDEADREGLGLTSNTIACDRTEVRYRVLDASTVQAWRTYRVRLDRSLVSALELGRRHAAWYVSAAPVPVEVAP